MPDPGEASSAPLAARPPAPSPRDRSEAVVAAVATAVGLMAGSIPVREFAGPMPGWPTAYAIVKGQGDTSTLGPADGGGAWHSISLPAAG